MPRLNLYEMANPFRAPRSSGADFGAAPAQALEGFGDEALKIGERIQRREENAISDKVFGEVNTQALPLLNDFEKKHDIALPQALNEFQGAMQKIKADALSKATLRPEARAALERQLDNQITQYGKSAIGMRIKAGNDAMVARLNEQFDTGVNQVGAAPSIMKDVIDTNVAFVESRKDSMDPLMYQAAIKKAHAGPIQAAVNSYLAQQLPDKADELLQNPEINKLIDPDALRPLRINVAVEKGKKALDVERQERNIAVFEARHGPTTPEMKARIRMMPGKGENKTLADEVFEYESVTGKPADQDTIDRIAKIRLTSGDGGGSFGNSLEGRARDFVSKNATAYANRMLDENGMRTYEQSLQILATPVLKQNPITKQWEEKVPALLPWMTEALNRGGGWQSRSGSVTPGTTNATGDNLRPPGETTTLYRDGQPIGEGVADASGRWTIPAPPEGGEPSPSWGRETRQSSPVPEGAAPPSKPVGLFNIGKSVVGPGPAIGRVLGDLPIPVGLGGESIAANQYVVNQKKDLMRALAISPQYAQGEQKLLAEQIDLDPKLMSNPDAWELRVVSVARTITETMDYNAKVIKQASTGETSDEQYKKALESQNLLRDFLGKMDLPPRIKSKKDDAFMALKKGDKFIDANTWQLLTKN